MLMNKEGASAPISEKTTTAQGKSVTLPMMDIRTVPIEKILITERIRAEEGNLEDLAKNIGEFGLINPITVMEQEKGGYVLIAGYRRMKACEMLGFTAIMATVLSAVAAEERLKMEISENVERKDFTTSEKLEFSRKLRVVEEEKARQRMSKNVREKIQQGAGRVERPTHDKEFQKGRAREIVAKAVGIGSGRQLERAEYLAKNRPDLLAKVDSRETSLYGAYMEARSDEKNANQGTAEEKKTALKIGETPKRENAMSQKMPEQTTHQESKVYTAPENESSPAKVGLYHPELWKPLDVYYPGLDKNTGTGIKGANHAKLMENRIYATLNEKYTEAVQSVNIMVGSYTSAKNNMEMQIKSINSNLQAVIRERDSLREKLAAKEAEIEQIKQERTLYHEERDEFRNSLEASQKEIERLEKKTGKQSSDRKGGKK